MPSYVARASTLGVLSLVALILFAGRCGRSVTVRVPTVGFTTAPDPIVPDCEKRFEVDATIEVSYPPAPAGAPTTPVTIDVTPRDLVNVDPFRVVPDTFDVTADSRPIANLTSALQDACQDGRLDVVVTAKATDLDPTRDISPFPQTIDVEAVGLDVTQEIVVEVVDEQAGTFEADFELDCCATSSLLFDILIDNEQNIRSLDFDPAVVVDTRFSCPRTGPPKRYKLVGQKAEAELGASFRVGVFRIPPPPECKFETVLVP